MPEHVPLLVRSVILAPAGGKGEDVTFPHLARCLVEKLAGHYAPVAKLGVVDYDAAAAKVLKRDLVHVLAAGDIERRRVDVRARVQGGVDLPGQGAVRRVMPEHGEPHLWVIG